MVEEHKSELKRADFALNMSRRKFMLTLAAALSASGLQSLAASSSYSFQPFSFALISDTHLATGLSDNLRLLQESQLFLQDVAKAINETNPDFVIFAGDQVEGPGRDEAFWNLFIDVMANVGCPWYFVLGESDVTGTSSVDRMRTFGPDLKARGLTSGKSYWSCDPVAGVHLVGLDTAKANSNSGDLSDSQLAWLKNDLAENRGKLTIVVSHHPLLAPPPYDGGPPFEDYTTVQGASAREIMSTSDVRLALSGHVPVNKVQREGEIWYVSCPSVAMYPCQFKTFQVTPQAVFMETHSIRYPALVKKAQKIMAGSSLAFQYSNHHPDKFLQLVEGNELDRNAALPLAPGPAQKLKKQKGSENKAKKKADTDKGTSQKQSEEPAQAKEPKELKESPKEQTKEKPAEKKSKESKSKGKTDSGNQTSPKAKSEKPPEPESETKTGTNTSTNTKGDAGEK